MMLVQAGEKSNARSRTPGGEDVGHTTCPWQSRAQKHHGRNLLCRESQDKEIEIKAGEPGTKCVAMVAFHV
eukprot:1292443-Rhodomonas_salina.1